MLCKKESAWLVKRWNIYGRIEFKGCLRGVLDFGSVRLVHGLFNEQPPAVIFYIKLKSCAHFVALRHSSFHKSKSLTHFVVKEKLVKFEHMSSAGDEHIWKGLEKYKDNDYTPPRWTPESSNVEMLLLKLDNGTFNVNPPHQRDVVHNTVWKGTIISSVFETGCIPETFWHPAPGKPYHFDSVDGKQRCCAFRDYVKGEFKWERKFFNELPKKLQFRIMNFNITISKADRTLTDEELHKTFKRFQVTKETKLGEQWNADTCELKSMLQKYVEEDEESLDERSLFTKKIPNRHQLLELYGTLFAYFMLDNVASTRKGIEPCWFNNRTLSEQVNWGIFRESLCNMWYILESNLQCPQKRNVSTRARPLFGLLILLRTDHRAKVVEHLKTSLILHEKKYQNVNGNHNAQLTRMNTLKESVKTYFSDSLIYKT